MRRPQPRQFNAQKEQCSALSDSRSRGTARQRVVQIIPRVARREQPQSASPRGVLVLDERLKEKKRERRKKWLKLVVGILAPLVVTISLVWLVFFSTVFTVTLDRVAIVGVDGNSIIQDADVDSVLAGHEGDRIALLDIDALAAELEEIPEVHSAVVQRRFPRALTVELSEQHPFGCWGSERSCVVLASDGSILRVPAEMQTGLPILEVADSQLEPAVFMKAISAVSETLDPQVAQRVVSFALSEGGEVSFQLDSGATVRWGDADDAELKRKVLGALLAEDHSLYDVSIPSSPVTQ